MINQDNQIDSIELKTLDSESMNKGFSSKLEDIVINELSNPKHSLIVIYTILISLIYMFYPAFRLTGPIARCHRYGNETITIDTCVKILEANDDSNPTMITIERTSVPLILMGTLSLIYVISIVGSVTMHKIRSNVLLIHKVYLFKKDLKSSMGQVGYLIFLLICYVLFQTFSNHLDTGVNDCKYVDEETRACVRVNWTKNELLWNLFTFILLFIPVISYIWSTSMNQYVDINILSICENHFVSSITNDELTKILQTEEWVKSDKACCLSWLCCSKYNSNLSLNINRSKLSNFLTKHKNEFKKVTDDEIALDQKESFLLSKIRKMIRSMILISDE